MWRLRWRLIELSVSSQSGLFDQYPVASVIIIVMIIIMIMMMIMIVIMIIIIRKIKS